MRRATRLTRSFLAIANCIICCCALCSSLAVADDIRPELWCTQPSGGVNALLKSGSVLYVGGAFVSLGPPTGTGVVVRTADGSAWGASPKIAGEIVSSVVSDGVGGWFVGGDFAAVGGERRTNLAHVLRDGSVAPWAPVLDGAVYCQLLVGRTLYVGGEFKTVDSKVRPFAAAFDVTSGALLPWSPAPNQSIRALALYQRHVIAGGRFISIGGQSRNFLAQLDPSSGRATSWNPDADSWVSALAIHQGTLFVGGYFFNLGGQLHKYLGAVDLSTGQVLPWNAQVDRFGDIGDDGGPRVLAMQVWGNALYVAGSFSTVGGRLRPGLAAVDPRSGTALPWDPQAVGFGNDPTTPFFNVIRIHGGVLYAGGAFSSLGGRNAGADIERYAGAVDARTGIATAWNPRPNGVVCAMDDFGDHMFIGGRFSSAWDWVRRNGLAAIDLETGRPTSWDPDPNRVADVTCLAKRGGTIYVGGIFLSVGGQPRTMLAAVDSTTGLVTPWNPSPDGFVYSLALGPKNVYVGGWFSFVGGQARYDLAALDPETGQATAWDPHPNDIVLAMAASGRTVYIGGFFTKAGNANRSFLAALDDSAGLATPWTADADAEVLRLALSPDRLYCAGSFRHINGADRNTFGAVDLATGAVTSWTPNADGDEGLAIAADMNSVYIGGLFRTVGGEGRFLLAATSAATGEIRAWNPDVDASVRALLVDGGVVYVGGAFDRVGVIPSSGLAAIKAATADAKEIRPALAQSNDGGTYLAQNSPNPVRSVTAIRFGLAAAATVSLEVYDVQGRRMATLLNRDPQSAGLHELSVRTEGWPTGVYLYRLQLPDRELSRKMFITR